MGGSERARVFGDVEVRLVDIDADKDVGFVVPAGGDSDGVCVFGALQRNGRLYR